MTALYPGFLKYQQDKITAKDEPRIGARSLGRVKKSVVHAPTKPAGKYAMPVIAVVAAVASFVEGAAMVSAFAAGAAGITSAIIGGAMVVGAAMTVVGTVTGNEKLAKWGSILSLVGGVAGAVTGTLVNPLAAAGESTAGVGANGALTVDGAGLASETGNAAANAVNNVASSSAGGILNSTPPISEMAGSTASTTAADAVAKAGSNAAQTAEGGISASYVPGAEQQSTFQAGNSAGNVINNKPSTGILNWVKDNKDAATLLSNTATPLLGSLVTSDKDKALIEQSKVNNQYTQEQIAALRAEEERKARRTANMSGKLYVPKAG